MIRDKNFEYRTLISSSSNEDNDIDRSSYSQSQPYRSRMFEGFHRRKSQSIFFVVFVILVIYIVFKVLILDGSAVLYYFNRNHNLVQHSNFVLNLSTIPPQNNSIFDYFKETDSSSLSNESVEVTEVEGIIKSTLITEVVNDENQPEREVTHNSGISDTKISNSSYELPSTEVGESFEPLTSTEKEISTTPSHTDEPKLACQIPRLNPFDNTIKHLIEEPSPINCRGIFPLLFVSTPESTLIPTWNVKEVDPSIQSCCYKGLVRGIDEDDPDNTYSLSNECLPLSINNSTIVDQKYEYVAINCEKWMRYEEITTSEESIEQPSTTTLPEPYLANKTMDLHLFVHKKPEVETRINKYYGKLDHVAKNDSEKHVILEEERVNVVILGIDAVSHMNFIRTMPETYSFLMKNLSAIEMQAYNKVGDNTYPNLAAALAALNISSLESTCENDEFFDDCPFIWKTFAENGYRTSYAEDSAWMSAFNYMKRGFRKPPTDYYFRPFGLAAEDLIGTFKELNAKLCYGPRLSFEVLLDYMRKFAYTMGHHKRYFQFIWATSLTHDFLNYGRLGDRHLRSTLKWFSVNGHLNRTVFILMSDHGIRWGDIHDFLQGQMEERLPFLYFITPSWFQEKYNLAFQNLKANTNKLTTPFDLHETLIDLLDLTRLENDSIAKRQNELDAWSKRNELPRGISHFVGIPPSRTCKMAQIEEHYCTCHNLIDVNTNATDVQQAANYIVYSINSMISKYPKCAFLTLSEIRIAHLIDYGLNLEKAKGGQGYALTIKTSPGNAVFSASVSQQNETGSWDVAGPITRTNLYGNQSHCVDDKQMKLYCYCVDNLV